MNSILEKLRSYFYADEPTSVEMEDDERGFLETRVSFYRQLNDQDKHRFEQRCLSFIGATEFVGHHIEVTIKDKLLIASASVILAWGFTRWHYVKVDTVILVSGSFNEDSKFGQHDSNISELVGTHHLDGKMILSQAALHFGFSNDADKRNVAIHEFSHLIDMADGEADGLPKELCDNAFALA